jgi:hypothetical protein
VGIPFRGELHEASVTAASVRAVETGRMSLAIWFQYLREA